MDVPMNAAGRRHCVNMNVTLLALTLMSIEVTYSN